MGCPGPGIVHPWGPPSDLRYLHAIYLTLTLHCLKHNGTVNRLSVPVCKVDPLGGHGNSDGMIVRDALCASSGVCQAVLQSIL